MLTRHPKPNPVAKMLDTLTRPLLEKLDLAVDEVTTEIMCEHLGFQGYGRGDTMELIPATNEEARELMVVWMPTHGKFDLRKPIPAQYSRWMRAQAKLLLDAADAVEAIEDGRDLKLIRDLVAGRKSVIDAAKFWSDDSMHAA